jgi:hypothetical protein
MSGISDPDPTAIDALREKWGEDWHIWRARSYRDTGDERTGDFMATRLNRPRGAFATLMCDSPAKLDLAIDQQMAKTTRTP